MPLASLHEVLGEAITCRYAVGAFDTMDHLFTEAVLRAAERTNTPVILMMGDFPGPDYANLIPYTLDRISRTRVPVCLHFDHGVSFARCANALRLGFSSVMIDGSMLPFEENVRLTRSVTEMAHACGVDAEGEIGHVGAGQGTVEQGGDGLYTSLEDAVRFAQMTGVDAMAVAIGTVHGVYRQAPELNFPLLSHIREAVGIPLVMHGGSGLSDADFRGAIANGINKINAYTNLSVKAVQELRDIVAQTQPGGTIFPVLDALEERIAQEVERHIQLFGTPALK